jgi:hypothetical protein
MKGYARRSGAVLAVSVDMHVSWKLVDSVYAAIRRLSGETDGAAPDRVDLSLVREKVWQP